LTQDHGSEIEWIGERIIWLAWQLP
jgi:hypothetical protein